MSTASHSIRLGGIFKVSPSPRVGHTLSYAQLLHAALWTITVAVALLVLLNGGLWAGGGAPSSVANGPLRVDFDPFVSSNRPIDVTVHLSPRSDQYHYTIALGRVYADRMQLGTIEPEPISRRTTPDRLLLTFDHEALRRTDMRIKLRLHHAAHGHRWGVVQFVTNDAGQGPQVAFNQLVYP
jgi:hypothetical protein